MLRKVVVTPSGRGTAYFSVRGEAGPIEDTITLYGDFEVSVEELDLDSYVQVRYTSGWTSRLYTYRDPSRSLQVGDLVEVTTTRSDIPQIARVEALGRGDWKGEVKDVVSRLRVERI